MEHIFYDSDEYILKAHEYIDEWNYLEAKKLLIKLLEDQPDHGPAHFLLGRIYSQQLQDAGTAIYHYKKALQHCPILIETYYYLISLYISRGDYSKAVVTSNVALNQSGIAEDLIWYFQAQALEKSGKFEAALLNYQKACMHSIDDDLIGHCQSGTSRIKNKQEVLMRKRVSYWTSEFQLA